MNCIQAITQKRICKRCKQKRINCVCFTENKQTGNIEPEDISLCNVFKKIEKNKN